MTSEEKIALMSDAEVRKATARLLDAIGDKYLGLPICEAIKGFEPSPLNRVRAKLKAAGFVKDASHTFACEGQISVFVSSGPNEVWILPETAT